MTAHSRLTMLLPAQKRRYAQGMELIEGQLQEVAMSSPGELGAACTATLRAGGKRVRPLLTLLCARNDMPLGRSVIDAATSVELLHAATLVHDDVLDGAALRRGRPTVAREYGLEMAVSSGNLLLARSFRVLARTGDQAAVSALSGAALRLAQGEVLQRDQKRVVTLSRAEYERRCELKTADLFAVACRLGAGSLGSKRAGAGGSGGVRPPHRSRLPGARRCARLQR